MPSVSVLAWYLASYSLVSAWYREQRFLTPMHSVSVSAWYLVPFLALAWYSPPLV